MHKALNEFEIQPGSIPVDSNILQFFVVAGPDILTQVSPDENGFVPALVSLQHPGTGHVTPDHIVYIRA